jgi:hypothetical protein
MSMYGMYGMYGIMGGAYMYRYTHIAPIPNDAKDLIMRSTKNRSGDTEKLSTVRKLR